MCFEITVITWNITNLSRKDALNVNVFHKTFDKYKLRSIKNLSYHTFINVSRNLLRSFTACV